MFSNIKNSDDYNFQLNQGTTTNGQFVKKFKSSIFQSAIISNCDIQPITIQYIRNNKLDNLAPYNDNNNFVLHLLKIMSQPQTIINLHLNKKIASKNENRHYLIFMSQHKIETSLNFNLDII